MEAASLFSSFRARRSRLAFFVLGAQRSARPLRVVSIMVALAAAVLCVAPVAQARFIRAPKWLKGPYRQYLLTYSATSVSQGQSSNRPTAGCVGTVNTVRGNSTVHWEATYQFLFGRYRPPHARYHTAFVFRTVHHAPGGQVSYTLDTAPPPGCPDNPDQRVHTACTQRILEAGVNPLGIGDLRPSHGASRYTAGVLPDVDEGDCQESGGAGADQAPAHFVSAHPPMGTITFNDKGVFARRTFQGTVRQDPHVPSSGQGTDTDSDGNPTQDWTYSSSTTGTLKLAPVGH
jgi:hypothetical protein